MGLKQILNRVQRLADERLNVASYCSHRSPRIEWPNGTTDSKQESCNCSKPLLIITMTFDDGSDLRTQHEALQKFEGARELFPTVPVARLAAFVSSHYKLSATTRAELARLVQQRRMGEGLHGQIIYADDQRDDD